MRGNVGVESVVGFMGNMKHERLTTSHLTGKPSRHLGAGGFIARERDGCKITHTHILPPDKRSRDRLTGFLVADD